MKHSASPTSGLVVLAAVSCILIAAGYLLWTQKRSTPSEGFSDMSGADVSGAAHVDRFAGSETETADPLNVASNLTKTLQSITQSEANHGEEFHIDAGGSFLEAYKKLAPDQIASMTKDTRELIETQKQLMGTLSTLKPLISDGREMLKTFGDFFGSDIKI